MRVVGHAPGYDVQRHVARMRSGEEAFTFVGSRLHGGRTVARTPLPRPPAEVRRRVRSDRLYDARYRQRRRSSPLGAIVGLLIVVLITGTVLVGGSAYLGQALIAIAGPDPSGSPAASLDPAVAAAGRTPRPD